MMNTNNFITSALKPIDPHSLPTAKPLSDDTKSIKKYKTYAYSGAGAITALFGSIGYSVAHDDFKNQKDEIMKKNNSELDTFINLAIKKRKAIEGNIPQSEIDGIIDICNERYARKLDRSIAKLKNDFKSVYINKTLGSALCGAILGGLVISKMYSDVKKKTTINSAKNNQQLNSLSRTPTINTQKKISFGNRYWNNELYTDEEEKIAQEIANYPLDESWIDTHNELNQLIINLQSKLGQPIKNDFVTPYYDYLLSLKIPVHSDPPSSFSLWDKIFETHRYKDYQNREIYLQHNKRFKKIRKLTNYLRLEKLEQEKKRIEKEIKLQMQSAFIKSKLFHNFISIINNKNHDKKGLIPNAIMLEGENKEENIKTIKWFIDRSNANYIYLDYNPLEYNSPTNFLTKVESALEAAQNNYQKTNGQRTILYINNFDTLIQKGMDTSDLKNLIQELNEEYKTTLVFETIDSSKLDPVVLQDHRFGLKYSIKDNIDPKTFKELELEFFKTNTIKISNSDGYRFNYFPGKEKYVDMYLGSFGYDKNTLWLEGKDFSDIEMGCTFINSIKKLRIFNQITKIQTKSNSEDESKLFLARGFSPINKYTMDKQMIWEKQIN